MGKESLDVYTNMIYTDHRDESIGSIISKATQDFGPPNYLLSITYRLAI